ncbi:glycosyltransferase family 39 protein [Candidatus Woesearchaeota archaeon]|nr:glycosyltransferase family 39 protein [Candidatus Woesearchaeota archaeon]
MVMKWLAVLFFFVFSFLLGYSLLRILKVKYETSIIERIVMPIGFGLATLPLFSVVMNYVWIPLDYRIFLVLSLIIPVYDVFYFMKNKQKISFFQNISKKEMICFVFVILFFAWHLNLFVKGSFTYDYLEDGDPWIHANIVQYISTEKTYAVEKEHNMGLFKYTEPYPPFLDVLYSQPHQIYPNANWILKIFNSLLISLSIFFIYFLVKQYTRKPELGVAAAFLLTVIPSYLSHFIFSAAYATVMFFPALYAMIKTEESPEWWKVAAVCYSAALMIQPITAALFLMLIGIYWGVTFLWQKDKHKVLFKAMIVGLLLSQLFWIPMFIKFDYQQITAKMPFGMFSKEVDDSSGGIIYGLRDYMLAHSADKIDQATGFGIAIFFMLTISLIIFLVNFKKLPKNRLLFTALIYGFFVFLGTESNALPYSFVPHRLWTYLAIAVVLMCTFGLQIVTNSIRDKRILYVTFLIIGIAVFYTSAPAKEAVQTAVWPSEMLYDSSPDYAWVVKNLPENTPFWAICSFKYPNGLGMFTPIWDEELQQYPGALPNATASQILEIAQRKGIKYISLDGACLRTINETQLQQMGTELLTKTKLVYSTNSLYIMELQA